MRLVMPLLVLLVGAGCANASERFGVNVFVDTVQVGSARGMRCCCPCDYALIRLLTVQRPSGEQVFTVLDTLEWHTISGYPAEADSIRQAWARFNVFPTEKFEMAQRRTSKVIP